MRHTYRRYIDEMKRVIRAAEGPSSSKQLYISEIGWPSNRDTPEDREFQARNLSLALELMANDPAVAVGIWFCTEDFAPAFERARSAGRPSLLELRVDPEAITVTQSLSEIRAKAESAASTED